MSPRSRPQLRYIDPATFLPRFEAELCQLHATSPFQKIMRKRRIFRNMPQEQFPLDFEPVVEDLIVRHVLPLLAKAEWVLNIRVPDRTRRIHAVLRPAFTQASDSTSQRAVHLQAEEFI